MGEGGFNGQGEPITGLGRVLTTRHTSSPTGAGERRIVDNECGVGLTKASAIIYNRQWVWCGWRGLPINHERRGGRERRIVDNGWLESHAWRKGNLESPKLNVVRA